MRRAALPIGAALVALVAVAWLAAGRRDDVPRQRAPHAAAPRRSPSPALVATRFLTGLSLPVVENARRRDAYLARFAAQDRLDALRRQYAAEAKRVTASFATRPRVAWTGLLAHRDQHLGASEVRVDVWAVAVGGAGNGPVAVGWQLLRVTLVHENAHWKVAQVQQRLAPDLHTDAAALAAATVGFREYHVAP